MIHSLVFRLVSCSVEVPVLFLLPGKSMLEKSLPAVTLEVTYLVNLNGNFKVDHKNFFAFADACRFIGLQAPLIIGRL